MAKNSFALQRKYLEFFPALFEVLWGLWILNPFENTFKITTAYRVMASIAPEWVWGTVILLIGIFQLVVIFTPNLRLRLASSVACLFVFIVLALLILAGNVGSVTIPSYLVFALCEWFAYTELLADIKEAKPCK
jgi:hypothetical protein